MKGFDFDELGPIRYSEELLKEALVLNPAFVDKNVHETMVRLHAYRIHQQKLIKMKRQTEIKKMEGQPADLDVKIQRKVRNHNRIFTKDFDNWHKQQKLNNENVKILNKINEI